jgi:hypothetical protein
MTVAEEVEDMGLNGVEIIEMDRDESVREIVGLCDPRLELNSQSQFISFWMRARGAIDRFMNVHHHSR